MTIIEAMKSGKPFKRPTHTAYMVLDAEGDFVGTGDVDARDVLAEDWELEIKPTPVTRAQVAAAWDTLLAHVTADYMGFSKSSARFDAFCRALGIKE